MFDHSVQVLYHDHMGSDKTVVDAARISLDSDDQTFDLSERDEKLIKYLAKNKHLSCFEHCTLTAVIICPLFTRSHIHRHRTFSYNEVSRRYTSENLRFWIPEEWLRQADSNRQSSSEPLHHDVSEQCDKVYTEGVEAALQAYEHLLDLGVSREQARAVLPQGLYTRFYMTGNLRNWAAFVRLRHDPDNAQAQDVQLSQGAIDLLSKYFPISMKALMA